MDKTVEYSPEAFWEEFADALRARLEADPGWEQAFAADAKWTAFMRGVIHDAVRPFGCRDDGLGSLDGTFNLDFGCFTAEDAADPKDASSWDLRIAIEHENAGRTWHDEWVQLAHLICDLRVVISYDPAPRDLSASSQVLARARKLVLDRKFGPPPGGWLLILGPAEGANGEHDWVAFAFDGEEFRELPQHAIFDSVREGADVDGA